ncbi:MAG: thiamine pyrophosphate-dependent dehydrogenase E1 component subunit alpha [Gemmatimonadota bacterium]
MTGPDLLQLCRFMHVTRALEERLEVLFKQGHVVGELYRSLGQEGTAVASAFALQAGDWLAPSIRDMGALLVRGLDPAEMLRQYTARGGSLCAGKDNTTQFTVPDLGLVGPVSPLGTQLCVLNGVALSFKVRGQEQVCMTYQGEGASRTGASHEGMNFAAALELPMVVVLEHNRWALGTPSTSEAAVERWLDVAEAYGVPCAEVDGNDVLQVYDEAVAAVARARRGEGMTLIVAETYRMLGHAQHDAQKYAASEELERWRDRDPIALFEAYLIESGFAERAQLDKLKSDVEKEIAQAAAAVIEEPVPEALEARTRVYADEALDPPVPWTRQERVYADLTTFTPTRQG